MPEGVPCLAQATSKGQSMTKTFNQLWKSLRIGSHGGLFCADWRQRGRGQGESITKSDSAYKSYKVW